MLFARTLPTGRLHDATDLMASRSGAIGILVANFASRVGSAVPLIVDGARITSTREEAKCRFQKIFNAISQAC